MTPHATHSSTQQIQSVEALVDSARAGDSSAFGELVRRFEGAVYATALRRLGNPLEAEELAQEVFMRALRKIDQLENSAAFGGWLRTITENRAKRVRAEDLRRPQAPGGTAHQIIVGQAPDDANHVKQLMEEEWQKRCCEVALKRVRDETSKENWETFELCVLRGVPPDEVARHYAAASGAEK